MLRTTTYSGVTRWTMLSVIFCSLGLALLSNAADEAPAENPPEKPAPIPLSKLKLDLNKLKSWGAQKYIRRKKPRSHDVDAPPGANDEIYILKTNVLKDKIRLDDRIEYGKGEKSGFWEISAESRLESHLPTRSFDMGSTAAGGAIDYSAKIADGLLKYTVSTDTELENKLENKQIECSDHATSRFGVMRITTLLPRTPGKRYSIDSLLHLQPAFPPEMEGSWIIECKGLDTSQALAAKKWTRFDVTALDNKMYLSTLKFWVDETGRLQRFGIDDHIVVEYLGSADLPTENPKK